MSLKFKNPLAIPAVAARIDALPGEFSFCWAVRLKNALQDTSWHHVYNHALQRLFISDDPEDIKAQSLPPVLWYGVPEAVKRNVVIYHGHGKLPFPNLCGTYFVASMCRSTRLYLQSEMARAGIDCDVAFEHIGMTLNNKVYERQWQATVGDAIWDYAGKPNAGGVYCVRRERERAPIIPEPHPDGLDWLFAAESREQQLAL